MDSERYCRFCKCALSLSEFSPKGRRRVCRMHVQTMYRLRHTVAGGGALAVDHFRILKNAYQLMTKDARRCFGGLKTTLRIQDLAPLISTEKQYCLPTNPTHPLTAQNAHILCHNDQRKALLKLWEATHDAELYTAMLMHFSKT